MNIDSTLATALKVQVRRSTKSFALQEQIALVTGAGPTVNRAFADDQPHALAMVVQCSFLASVHKIDSLAAAIADYLERLNLEAPNNIDSRCHPSQLGLHGVMTACQEQTSAWDWEH